MKKSLFALMLGGFGIGVTEFIMMGILPNVANDMSITIPMAGNFITAYALGVVGASFSKISFLPFSLAA